VSVLFFLLLAQKKIEYIHVQLRVTRQQNFKARNCAVYIRSEAKWMKNEHAKIHIGVYTYGSKKKSRKIEKRKQHFDFLLISYFFRP